MHPVRPPPGRRSRLRWWLPARWPGLVVTRQRAAADDAALRNRDGAAPSGASPHGGTRLRGDQDRRHRRGGRSTARTFFNYFPTKELVLFLPQSVLPNLIRQTLLKRPAGEDPVASLAAAAIEGTMQSVAALAHADVDGLVLGSLRVMLREAVCRQLIRERHALAEDVAWATLQERGLRARPRNEVGGVGRRGAGLPRPQPLGRG